MENSEVIRDAIVLLCMAERIDCSEVIDPLFEIYYEFKNQEEHQE